MNENKDEVKGTPHNPPNLTLPQSEDDLQLLGQLKLSVRNRGLLACGNFPSRPLNPTCNPSPTSQHIPATHDTQRAPWSSTSDASPTHAPRSASWCPLGFQGECIVRLGVSWWTRIGPGFGTHTLNEAWATRIRRRLRGLDAAANAPPKNPWRREAGLRQHTVCDAGLADTSPKAAMRSGLVEQPNATFSRPRGAALHASSRTSSRAWLEDAARGRFRAQVQALKPVRLRLFMRHAPTYTHPGPRAHE